MDNPNPKTLLNISEVFGTKAFAIIFLILMSVPALPIPTGGITHVFEVIVMALALLFIIGQSRVPKRWHQKNIPSVMQKKTLPFLLGKIRTLERFSRPRLSKIMEHWALRGAIGLTIFIFTLTAFLAPPFSGLDTLPAMGVVIIALGLLLEDFLFIIAGTVVGSIGIFVVIGLGALVVNGFRSIFN